MPKDHLNHICRIVESLPHCQKLGLKMEELTQGKGRISLMPRPELVGNIKRGFLHSAVVTTLLDTLCGCVASSAYDGARTVATLDLRLDHLDILQGDLPLYAAAECYHYNDDVAYVRGWAWQEDETKHVAMANGTFMSSGSFQLIPEELS